MGLGWVSRVRLRDLPVVLFGRVAAAALLSFVSCVVGMPVTVTECMAEGIMPVVKVCVL